MAHGRTGPDLVMTIRYASYSDVRQVSEHEKNRTPDGSSDIDPARSHLNSVLHGPATQQDAANEFWASGVKKPAAQAESPFVQMVLSASPEYFRTEGRKAGEYDPARLDAWTTATMDWLRSEYGDDLAHVSLHLDEQTPHVHVLVIPTYEKKRRTPGKPAKGETIEAFEARKAAAISSPGIRTAGRASSEKWGSGFARLYARKSYAAALEPLGIAYGKDFIGEDEPSPEHRETGKWVREEAAKVKEDRAALAAERVQFEREREQQNRLILSKISDAETRATQIIQDATIKAERMTAAFEALSDEVMNGTLTRSNEGRLRVSNAEKIVHGGPAIKRLANIIVDRLVEASSFVKRAKDVFASVSALKSRVDAELAREIERVDVVVSELDRAMISKIRANRVRAIEPEPEPKIEDGPSGPSF